MIYKKYTFFQLIQLCFLVLITKLLFSKARLIRFPFFIRGKNFFHYGSGLTLGRSNRFEIFSNSFNKNPALVIGKNVQINDFNHIGCMNSIEIGDDCLLGSRITIIDHNHGDYKKISASDLDKKPIDRKYEIKSVIIGKNVWVGDNVVILPGSKIGDNVVIGAGSVVRGEFATNSLIVGNPAKIKRKWQD